MIISNIYEFGNDNADYSKLFSYLVKKLPPEIRGWKTKDDFHNRFMIETSLMLHKSKWIEYNQKWVNMLIFDIDDKTLEETLQIALKLDLEPSFACATDKGCHIFYSLDNAVQYNWEKGIKWVKDIKKALTHFLGADVKGSHRLNGIWRNPLQNDFYYSEVGEYNLKDFNDVLKQFNQRNKKPKQKFKTYINKTKRENGKFLFNDGNRNNWLWFMGMAETRNKNYSLEQIESYLNNLQHFQGVKGLESEEIEKIARSIKRYNDEGTNNIVFNPSFNRKPRNEGIMNLPPIRNLSKKDYKKEVKKRQQSGADYTNKAINQSKGKQMTREQNCLIQNENKENKNREIIKNFLTGLFADNYKKKNGKWNIVKIAEALKMSRITITKHLKAMGEV